MTLNIMNHEVFLYLDFFGNFQKKNNLHRDFYRFGILAERHTMDLNELNKFVTRR